MNKFKEILDLYRLHLILAAFIFILGLISGIALVPKCKTKEYLCGPSLKEITLLRQENKNILLKAAQNLDKALKDQKDLLEKKSQEKYKRLEKACNELDCAACKK